MPDGDQVSCQVLVFAAEFSHRWHMLSGYHQEMGGGLGVDVLERDSLVILVEDGCWYLASHDVTEDALLHVPPLEAQLRGDHLPVVVGIAKQGRGCSPAPIV
jgi:hypothetical protein